LVKTKKGFAFKSGWYSGSGRRIVKVGDFTADSVDTSNLVCIPEVIASGLLQYELNAGDVVIQTVGSWPSNPASVVGKCVRIPKDIDGALLNQNAVRLSPTQQLDSVFLYYLLRSDVFKNYIIGTAQGAASQAAITLEAIRAYTFGLPPFSAQLRIASILSTYDDLIENNTRRIAILEEMARRIFEEWFVHFRAPGCEGLPMVDSALGPVPATWAVSQITDLVKFQRGRSYRSDELVEVGGCPFVGLKCLEREGGFRPDGMKRIEAACKPEHEVRAADLLMALTDMTQKRLIVGSARITDLQGEVGVFSMDLAKVVPHSSAEQGFVYSLLRWSDYSDRVKEFANGANVLHLSLEAASSQLVLVPPTDLRTEFSSMIEPSLALTRYLEMQKRNLRAQRDHLLPKLISGEIDLSTSSVQIPEAAE